MSQAMSDFAPEPVRDNEAWIAAAWLLAGVVSFCGLGAVFFGAAFTTTRGASRSVRLQWEERSRQIAEVVAAESAGRRPVVEILDETPDLDH